MYYSKRNESTSTSNFLCYNCGKQGHINIEWPNFNQNKDKSEDRKHENKFKEKHAYIVWWDNDYSTSSSSQEETEGANLCLMAGYESSSPSQASSLSSKGINDYY